MLSQTISPHFQSNGLVTWFDRTWQSYKNMVSVSKYDWYQFFSSIVTNKIIEVILSISVTSH